MNKVQRQSMQHNERMRQVRHVHSYQLNRFLRESDGNLLINGGMRDIRRECLLRVIADIRAESKKTIVVFSEDCALEEQLIRLAQCGNIGQLYVCSKRYPSYDFFSDMPRNFVCDFFNSVATEKGFRDTTEMNGYICSFLSILSKRFPISLPAICQFSKNNDASIAKFSDDPFDSEMILSSTKGGVAFRSLLCNSVNAFSSLTTPKCETRVCLNNQINQDCVIMINAPTQNQDFFSTYFATELECLSDKQFVCIFDDTVMLNNKAMQSVVNLMKQRQGITVIVSHENVVAIEGSDNMMKNFNRNMIFLNGNTPSEDLQKVLSEFGQYTHMKPMESSSTPPMLLFSLFKSKSQSAVPYVRDRVILQEESENEVLLKGGSSSEIVIAKYLTL